LEQIETELLWPIQLWSTKVSLTTLERLIPLLIDKYYDAPSESIFIRVWQMLAHSIVQQRQLILAIITKCTDIMEKQEKYVLNVGEKSWNLLSPPSLSLP
jgi:hypothetical protein